MQGGAIGASSTLNTTQQLTIVADEPGQVADINRTVDRVYQLFFVKGLSIIFSRYLYVDDCGLTFANSCHAAIDLQNRFEYTRLQSRHIVVAQVDQRIVSCRVK